MPPPTRSQPLSSPPATLCFPLVLRHLVAFELFKGELLGAPPYPAEEQTGAGDKEPSPLHGGGSQRSQLSGTLGKHRALLPKEPEGRDSGGGGGRQDSRPIRSLCCLYRMAGSPQPQALQPVTYIPRASTAVCAVCAEPAGGALWLREVHVCAGVGAGVPRALSAPRTVSSLMDCSC